MSNKIFHLTGRELGIRELVSAAFPEFRGKKISFTPTDIVSPKNTYWDSGSRYSYSAVNLSTLKSIQAPQFDPERFGGPKLNHIDMVPGIVVCELHSYSCEAYMRIYCHPKDAPRMLPSANKVTENERVVLQFTSRYKNTYGGRTNVRFAEANRETGIDTSQWESAKTSLIGQKLLTRTGAITASGRNAIA